MKRGKGKGPGDYDIGFGRPPRHRRFPPGTSGNPRGRPKRARGKHKLQDAILQRAREIFFEESERKVTVREGDRVITLEAYRVAVRAAFMSAAKGSAMAQRTVIQTRLAVENEIAGIMQGAFTEAVRYKQECDLVRRRCRASGLPEPIFPVDPDDIVTDWDTLTIEMHGPVTPDQRAELEHRLQQRAEWEDDFEFCRKRYEEGGRSEGALIIALQSQCMFDRINDSLPERYRKELKNRLPNPYVDPGPPRSRRRRRSAE